MSAPAPRDQSLRLWFFIDFRSPNRFHPQNQEGWNRKGLVSDKGQRKKAWWVMKEFYEGK